MNIKIRVSIILIISLVAYMFYIHKNIIFSFIFMNIMFAFVIISKLIEDYKKIGKVSLFYILPLILQLYLMYNYLN